MSITNHVTANRNIAPDNTLDELVAEVFHRATIGGYETVQDARDIAADYLTELGMNAEQVNHDPAYEAMHRLMIAIVQINSAAYADRAARAYPYIIAWGRYMRSGQPFITDQTLDALRDSAPAGAYTRSHEGEWLTIGDLPADVLRNVLDYMPKFK